MGIPHFEVLSGAVNGVNLVFTTSVPYTAGTLAVYLNGQLLLNPGGNPWTETNPATGAVTIHSEELPETGDVVAAFYLDTTNAYTGEEVEQIYGSINEIDDLAGILVTAQNLSANVYEPDTLSGILTDQEIEAGLYPISDLTGVVTEC
jgi:hypothetical protein